MYQWALKPADCSKRALELQKKGKCNFFMHSDDHPVRGCSCCDQYEPVADKKDNFSIYQTCVDTTTSSSTYQKCFNEVNLYRHNGLRKTHGAAALKTDKTLAEGAAKRAKAL
jgi:hypothetical protein